MPPSSKLTGVTLRAADSPILIDVGTDPVKQTRRTSGCATRGAPASVPKPCTTLKTPAGSPASCAMSAKSDAVSGAHSGGLATTVLPAASAGPMRQVASISGAFHGVTIAVTPAGSQLTWLRWPRVSKSGWPSSFSA